MATINPTLTALPAHASDEIRLRDLFDLLRSGWLTLLVVAGATFLAGVCVQLFSTPTYTSVGMIQVFDQSKKFATLEDKNVALMLNVTPAVAIDETQVLESRAVLDPVIDRLHLDIKTSADRFPVLGTAWARYVHSNGAAPSWAPWPLRGYAWGGEKIDVDQLDVPRNLLGKPLTLQATAQGYRVVTFWGRTLVAGKVGEDAASDDGSIKLRVKTLVARPRTEFTIMKIAKDDAAIAAANALKVQQQPQSGILQLTYNANSRKAAMDFINTVEAAYLEENVKRRATAAQAHIDFLQGQRPLVTEKLKKAQDALAAYQQEHEAPNVSSESKLLLENGVTLETRRLDLITKLDQVKQLFAPEHPQVRALAEQLASVERQEQELAERVNQLPVTTQEVLALTREVKSYTQLYENMVSAIQGYESAKEGTEGNVRVVDFATDPQTPTFPRASLILPAALSLGLFLAVAVVFAQRAMVPGIDNPAAIERDLGLPLAAIVPYSHAQPLRPKASGEGGAPPLLVEANPQDNAVDALHGLRALLPSLLRGRRNNVVMLCGPRADSGSSFVTVNLATLLAKAGARTVVVDADLRRAEVHGYLGGAPSPGVADFVQGTAALEVVLRQTATPGLAYVAASVPPVNVVSLLLSPQFDELIARLSREFDYVLVDAPPILQTPDAAAVARVAGMTLLVLRAAEHTAEEIRESVRRVSAAETAVAAVFNQFGRRRGSYGYGGYGYPAPSYGPKRVALLRQWAQRLRKRQR